ncbi:hypothetical protein V2J09_019720 [Rumex salicifolius]
MSHPHLQVQEGVGQCSVTNPALRPSVDSLLQTSMKERNYMGLSDCASSVDSSALSVASEEIRSTLNLKATELRLGLPGSQSPERNPDILFSSSKLDEKPLFPLHPLRDSGSSSVQKNVVSGSKRGFYDAMDGFSESKTFGNSDVDAVLSPRPSNLGVKTGALKEISVTQPSKMKDVSTLNAVANDTKASNTISTANISTPASKAQVVGWPPIRSFRKNSLAATSKNAEADKKAGPGALFVKVSMDGAPYLRKIDLKAYTAYQELSSSLEKMFSCFTIGQCASHGASGREILSESKLKDLLHGSEYVLTYEDKDGDWMLVGDVPWEMFIGTCKRLRIMKGSDAIGLAPRAVEKSKNRN